MPRSPTILMIVETDMEQMSYLNISTNQKHYHHDHHHQPDSMIMGECQGYCYVDTLWQRSGRGQRASVGLCCTLFNSTLSTTRFTNTNTNKNTHTSLQTWTSESGYSHLWRVVDIEMYGHVGLSLFIGVDCSVFLIHVRFVNSMK